MKKIINKIKNILLTVGIFLLTRTTKVFGRSNVIKEGDQFLVKIHESNNILDTEIRPLYGVPISQTIWKPIKLFIIPIAFIVGSIIYLNKSKSSKTRKIITLLIALILLIAICFGINYIINK